MLLALFCAALAGFGIWGTLRHWRHVTETQLRLDRCVGQSAQELKTTLVRLDFTNRRIKELRIAIIPAPPPLQIPLCASLELAAGFQEYLLLKWKAKQVLWMAHRGCLEFSDLAPPLPSIGMVRGVRDEIGSQPLRWPEGHPPEFKIRLKHHPRFSAASVKETANEWKANWTTWF
jgi:hypothetical protein